MGRGNYAHFTREIQGKDLTVMTVDIDTTIPAAQSINHSVASLRLFVKPFSPNFIEKHETMMLTDTGGLCR